MIQDNAPVSVVVPMANAKQTIGATLASTRRQIYLAPEMNVVDHSSRDGSGSTPDVRLCFGTLVLPSKQARVR
ncbi:MAG: glycosyltransferase [Mesorhizobium sp.]|nr:glycosyltransferase [Mesorhizobium sp. M1E.F.Ca.ET.045.02.1.1]TIU34594.1 MAG: glycosyltransferase [Mesorhizobium sp.]TKB17482.1 MAG: glycosyltransferase [Mesorhizobium sp.]